MMQTAMATWLQLPGEADNMSLQKRQGALTSRPMSARDVLSQISDREGASSSSRRQLGEILIGITQTRPSGVMIQLRIAFDEVRKQCDEALAKISEASDACMDESEVNEGCEIIAEAIESARSALWKVDEEVAGGTSTVM